METALERGRSLEAEKSANLSPTSTRARSKSLTPSVRSSRSDITIVGKQSGTDVSDIKPKPKRAKTQIVEAKISWWALIVGLFRGPKYAGRKIIVDAYERSDSEGESDDEPYHFIHTVRVKTSGKSDRHEEGRCNFDTGCLQGNIVSLDFAEKLGFTSSDFKSLTRREKLGGTSATGHSIQPLGALKLTWYHESSVKIFSNMRFLVTSSANYDLIIGSDSLTRHKLMRQVNFDISAGQPDVHTINLPSNVRRERLKKKESDFKDKYLTLQKKILELESTDQRKKALEPELKKQKKQYLIAKTERELYDEQQLLRKDPEEKKHTSNVDELEKKLKKLTGDSANQDRKQEDGKNGNALAPEISPDITVSEPNGKTRVPTGLAVSPKHKSHK